MALELFTNNAKTTLAASVSAIATTISLAAGTGALFPNPSGGDFFHLTLDDGTNVEIVKVTARATDDVTVVRGQQGTSGTAFASGAKAELRLTSLAATNFQQKAEKGTANGYAGLDGSGQVPIAQLPATVVGAVDYQGTWNANTNSPDLPASTPAKGDYYAVSTAGSTSLGGITDWAVGDWAIYNGSAWEKVDNTDTAAAVLAAHVADADPHAQYLKESEADVLGGYPTLSLGPKIQLTHISGVMSSTGLTNDAALEKVANKGVASGYASLDASVHVPVAQIPLPAGYFGSWTAPLAISNWTARGTAFDVAVDDAAGGLYFQKNALAGVNMAMMARAKSGNYSVTICMITHLFNVATAQIGVGWLETATGKIVTIMDQRGGGLVVDKWNSNTSFSASYFFESCRPPSLVWFRLTKTASALEFYYSHDGVNFFQGWSSTYTNFFTTAPDEYVIALLSQNANRAVRARVLSVVEA